MSIRRNIQNFYGGKKTACLSVSITTLTLYCIAILFCHKYVKLEYIYYFLSQDIATTSGVLAGFLFTGVSILSSTNNSMMEKLKITKNTDTVFKIFFGSMYCFIVTLAFYFTKPLFIFDINLVNSYSSLKYHLLELFYGFSIYIFIDGFCLFIYAVYILNKILIPKSNS